jgi:hypothetical protein
VPIPQETLDASAGVAAHPDAAQQALPACTRITSTLPGPIEFFPREDNFPSEFQGRGVVVARSEVEVTIDVSNCCTFGLQRFAMPALFAVGEELDVKFGYAGGFFDSDWGLTLREPNGKLRFFSYAGGFTRSRFDALELDLEVEFADLCDSSGTCSVDGVSSTVTVVSTDGSVSLSSFRSGLLSIDTELYKVLDYVSVRVGRATGKCTDSRPPGEFLQLQIVPDNVVL